MALTAGAFALGLYRGEKGRRQAAESLLLFGTPEPAPARTVVQGAPLRARAVEPTRGIRGLEDETVKRGAKMLQDESKQAGIPIPDDATAEAMAREMLIRGDLVEVENDIAIPGAG